MVGVSGKHCDHRRQQRQLFQHALGVVSRPLFRGFEMLQQLRHGGSDELRARDERAVFRGDSPDAAVSVVATRVAEIDFAVLDDRVVPVGRRA